MSWTARITKAPDGELRLQFSEPLRHIDMDGPTARHLAALLVIASEGRRTEPLDGEHQKASLRSSTARRNSKPVITGRRVRRGAQ